MPSQRPNRFAIRRLLRWGAGCALVGTLVWMLPAQSPPSPPAAGSRQPGTKPTALPAVPRPPAAQPPVGLDVDSHLDKTPPRATKGLDLVKMSWSYNCMDCHRLLESRWVYDRPMSEHTDIVLQHGNNRFCLNCHHPTNRNAFVDYDGSEIPEDKVVNLCAKCHGTVYRDWEAGVHGRRNGYWDHSRGTQTRLRCIQCHDPHHPKYQILTPLKAPAYPARAGGTAQGKGKSAHPPKQP